MARDKWDDLHARISTAIEEWRQEHPEATLMEIEEAVDSRLATMRRQMVEDLAQAGLTANLRQMAWTARPRCPRCDGPVVVNGKKRRKLKTHYGQTIELDRHQAYCQPCELTFFPSGPGTGLTAG